MIPPQGWRLLPIVYKNKANYDNTKVAPLCVTPFAYHRMLRLHSKDHSPQAIDSSRVNPTTTLIVDQFSIKRGNTKVAPLCVPPYVDFYMPRLHHTDIILPAIDYPLS